MAEASSEQVTAALPGPRVLVVDDTDEVRTLIGRALAAHGYRVDAAATLAQASALDPAGYDAVLVDAHLGAELGTDLIETMLAQDPAAARRCLVITGGSTAIVPHGVACLAKPFRPADLLHAVRALHQQESAGIPVPRAGPTDGRPEPLAAVPTENGSPRPRPPMPGPAGQASPAAAGPARQPAAAGLAAARHHPRAPVERARHRGGLRA